MSEKIYKSTTGVEYMFHVPVGDKEVAVWTRESGNTFSTSDKELQTAIENHELFTKGAITIIGIKAIVENEKDDKDNKADTNADVVTVLNEYPEVKNMGEAVDVLRGEPYNVPESELLLKKQVLAKAKELGIKFPNYR